MDKIAIITLVYREPHIYETIKSWKELMPDIPIYTFADGYDNTTYDNLMRLVREGIITFIGSSIRKGYPNAARFAFNYMGQNYLNDYDQILFVDSDDCYPVHEIKRMIEYPDNGDICGYRTHRHEAWYRKPYIWSEKLIMRVLFGIKMRDYTCAFRRMWLDRAYATILYSRYSPYGFWMEFDAIWYSMFPAFVEIPIEYVEQPSKIFAFKRMPKILFKEFIAILKTWWNLYS